MLPTFLLLIFLTLSASSQRILENQLSKSFLRIQCPEDDEESSITPQRMLQEDPVLTSVQQTMSPPPPGPPGSGSESQPTIVTTEIYVANVPNEEEIIIEVEDNVDPFEAIDAIGNVEPIVTNGEDVFISSWWTVEDEPTAFENWEQLESYLGSQYGSEPTTGIDLNVLNVPVEVEIEVPEVEEVTEAPVTQTIQNLNVGVIYLSDILKNPSLVDWSQFVQEEIEGIIIQHVTNLIVAKPKCKQIQTCQNVAPANRRLATTKVCKNQLVCPKS